VSEDFTAGDSMVGDFTAALFMAALFMPFTRLQGQDAVTARVASNPTLKSAPPAPAMRAFLEAPLQASTVRQAERFSVTPAR
jgi:hypothetical protein